MKASKLIKQIQKQIKEYGDLEIHIVINSTKEERDKIGAMLDEPGSFNGRVYEATGHVQACIFEEDDDWPSTIEIEGYTKHIYERDKKALTNLKNQLV